MSVTAETSIGGLAAFHDVGRLFSEEDAVLAVSPNTPVLEAIGLMQEHRYSQLPVVDGVTVLGIFSLWSLAEFAQNAAKINVKGLTVGDFVERVPRVTINDSLHSVYEQAMKNEALLVQSADGVRAIVTIADLLRYFYGIARPFALVQEIELALRALITHCAPGDQLAECIELTLSGLYAKNHQPLPTTLSELTFKNYVTLITSSRTYSRFELVLGRAKDIAATRLEQVASLRNDIFHFKRELTVRDHQTLVVSRDWLDRKLRHAGIVGRGGVADV